MSMSKSKSKSKSKRREFSRDFKLAAVKKVVEQGQSNVGVAPGATFK